MRKKPTSKINQTIKLLKSGKSQVEVARLLGVSPRTVGRWLADADVKARITGLAEQHEAITQSDPAVVSVVDIRLQVERILDYRRFEDQSAVELGAVMRLATALIKRALEDLQKNPEGLSIRMVPLLLRAVVDGTEKVSNCWARATGLEDLLEAINNEPQVAATSSKEA